MDDLEYINFIEDKSISINPNWYYHGTNINENNFESFITNGILCPKLLKNSDDDYQFVFVSKNMDVKMSSYKNYIIYPRFVISDYLKAVKYDSSFIKKILYNKFVLPKFTTLFDDEFQVYKKIPPELIIGIGYDINYLISKYPANKKIIFQQLYVLSRILKNYDSLKLMDISEKKEINVNKVLKINFK